MAVVDKPWDGSAGRFTDEQYERSAVLDRKVCGGEWADKPPKTRCSLPIKEPNGDINKQGVHAAAARIGQVKDACDAAMASAKSKLRSAYKTIGEDVPPSLGGSSKSTDVPGRFRERALASMPGEWLLREADDGSDYIGLLTGHFAVFNRWTEIDSFWEGRFMEQVAPGAFTKTFAENRQGMRVLLNHGRDPSFGMKPLGPIQELAQDEKGAYYEVGLLDTTYNRDLIPGLKAQQYGASFRFQIIREEVNTQPERSDHNPEGIEERTIMEAKVREFGPVTFPAYEDATAGLRSLNDQLVELGARDNGLDIGLFLGADPDLLAQFLSNLRSATHSSNGHEEETAPPKSAPETPKVRNMGRTESTHLPGAARMPLKAARGIEVPKWRM